MTVSNKWLNENLFCDWCTTGVPFAKWHAVPKLYRVESISADSYGDFNTWNVCNSCTVSEHFEDYGVYIIGE